MMVRRLLPRPSPLRLIGAIALPRRLVRKLFLSSRGVALALAQVFALLPLSPLMLPPVMGVKDGIRMLSVVTPVAPTPLTMLPLPNLMILVPLPALVHTAAFVGTLILPLRMKRLLIRLIGLRTTVLVVDVLIVLVACPHLLPAPLFIARVIGDLLVVWIPLQATLTPLLPLKWFDPWVPAIAFAVLTL